MGSTLRLFLVVEAITFVAASAVHFGLLIGGYEHQTAGIAESVIAAVLIGGLLVSWLREEWTREAALLAQGFALFGTVLGLFTIVVGVGPQTVLDILYHAAILAVLAWGLVVAWRADASAIEGR